MRLDRARGRFYVAPAFAGSVKTAGPATYVWASGFGKRVTSNDDDSRPGGFDERLRKARAARRDPLAADDPGAQADSDLALGLRVGLEIVAGVAVGGFLGYWADRWLGTSPWLMIVFVLFGFAGGVKNVLQTAARASAAADEAARAGDTGKTDATDDAGGTKPSERD